MVSSGIWLAGKSRATLETRRSVSPKSPASCGWSRSSSLAQLGVLLQGDLEGLLRLGGLADDRVEVLLGLDPLGLDLGPGGLDQALGLVVGFEVGPVLGQLDGHLAEQLVLLGGLLELAEPGRAVLAEPPLALLGPGLGGPEQFAGLPDVAAEPLGTGLGFGLADEFGEAFQGRGHYVNSRAVSRSGRLGASGMGGIGTYPYPSQLAQVEKKSEVAGERLTEKSRIPGCTRNRGRVGLSRTGIRRGIRGQDILPRGRLVRGQEHSRSVSTNHNRANPPYFKGLFNNRLPTRDSIHRRSKFVSCDDFGPHRLDRDLGRRSQVRIDPANEFSRGESLGAPT